jgi:membrane-anchored glycerophosphoryl diester phosphodiesterase (GDPDase)
MWKCFPRLLLIGIIMSVISSAWDIIWNVPGLLPEGDFAATAGIAILGIIFYILVSFPVEYSFSFVYLKAARNDKPEIRDIFKAYSNYWHIILASLLVTIIVGVGLVLLVIPGIIFACKLAFTPYLILDRRMTVFEAVKESWRMTGGHAWTVFFIFLLSIPISILGLICLIVGIIPATMWISVTYASLYHAVSVPSEAKMA